MHHYRFQMVFVALIVAGAVAGPVLLAQEILQIPPEALEAYHQGLFYGKSDKYVEAAQELRRAVAIYPDYIDAYNALGVVYHRQQNLQEAIENYQRAIELAPSHAKARTNLALVYKEQGKYAQALQQLEEAVRVDPAYAAAQALLPDVRRLLDEQQQAEAARAKPDQEADSRRADAPRPAERRAAEPVPVPPSGATPRPKATPRAAAPESAFEQATRSVQQGRLDEGIAAYRQALSQLPCSAEGLTLLGMAYREKFHITRKLDWQQEELLAFQKAIQCDPGYVPAILALGQTYYAQRDYANAARYFRYVLQFEPDHPAREQIEEFLRKSQE